MSMFINVTLITAAIYFIVAALMLNTKNFISTFLFKIVPFALGVACLLSYLYLIGFIIKSN